MSTKVSEMFSCPICIETLQKPIRILGCGHNLCHTCLVTLCRKNEDKRCPTCRNPIQLPGNKEEALPRNFDLETAIEELSKNKETMKRSQQTPKTQVFSPSAIKQLQDSAATYQLESNFQNAVETLQIVIDHVEGWDKLQPSIDQAECLLNLGKISEAKVVCVSIASIVDANPETSLDKQLLDDCYEHIAELAEKCLNVKEYDCAISLAHCRFQFIKKLYDGKSRLLKIANIGWLMAEISMQLSKNDKKQFKDQFLFLEECLEFMQNTNDVDLKEKCKLTAWFFHRFGICYNQVGDWPEAIIMFKSAIALMKTAFHADASQNFLFGEIYNNMADSLEKNNELMKAKAAYTKAIEIYNTASNWASEKVKSSGTTNSVKGLERIETKLSQH